MNSTLNRILITGSEGLIGSALRLTLDSKGSVIAGFDLKGVGRELGDVRDYQQVRSAVEYSDGIVHLAAVSRVIWGEKDPNVCWNTNVDGTANVVKAVEQMEHKPWLIFASSREVYGNPDYLPVSEDAPLQPVNIYGSTKVEGEKLVRSAQQKGVRVAIVRFSNVYGSTDDHHDRVVPAFTQNALVGEPLRVDGAECTFDFTYLNDVVQGLVSLIQVLRESKESELPPIHFVSGQATTLGELATLSIELTDSESPIQINSPREFDVSKFYGNWDRALGLLGWKHRVDIRQGLKYLIRDYRNKLGVDALRNIQ